jgi:hypothetical protein
MAVYNRRMAASSSDLSHATDETLRSDLEGLQNILRAVLDGAGPGRPLAATSACGLVCDSRYRRSKQSWRSEIPRGPKGETRARVRSGRRLWPARAAIRGSSRKESERCGAAVGLPFRLSNARARVAGCRNG